MKASSALFFTIVADGGKSSLTGEDLGGGEKAVPPVSADIRRRYLQLPLQ